MTIDEAIKHAKEVAKKQENNAKSYPRPNKSVKGSGRMYNAYLKSAEEHRQLAEWLKDYKRLLEQEPKHTKKISCKNCKNFNPKDNYCSLLQINWLPDDFGCVKKREYD